jgi:putative restriction endonuclease
VADLEFDIAMREAAFRRVKLLDQMYGTVPASKLAEGFEFRGERVPLIDPGRGIHKPRAMPFLLSIRTVFPRPGRKVWYDDQREIHQRIFQADETFGYDFMGKDPAAAHNRWLREAMLASIPIIYFLGIGPARYQAIVPTFIVGWEAENLRAQIAFGAEHRLIEGERGASPAQRGVSDPGAAYEGAPPSPAERRYALRTMKQRLHQASFREAVLEAYRGRCAFSGLPEPLLLDAAHIVTDLDERWGQPLVTNGLPLSKVHHAAFDAHLIGVDPDYRIHVSDRLLARHDGEILRALKGLNGSTIGLPRREQDAPSRERLEIRFAQL